MAKKTSSKSTKKTSKKVAAKRTAGKATAGTAPSTQSSAGAATARSVAKAVKEKQQLVEQMLGLGLLNQDAVDDLEKKAEELTGDAGLNSVAGWDRALGKSLADVDGSSGGPKKHLQALLVWQKSVRELPDTAEGIQSAITGLKKVIPYHGASFYLRRPEGTQLEEFCHVGVPVELINRIRFSEGMGFSSWVASRKQPVLYTSIRRNAPPGEDQIRSFMALPLILGGECVGVLNLGHAKDGAYDAGSLRAAIIATGILFGLVQRLVAREQIRAREIAHPASGLATTEYFKTRLGEEVVRCRELGHAMSLTMIQLNELDALSEQFGGDFRERCRTDLYELVRAWRGPTELVGHGSGDRIVVILPSARREKAESRLEALAALVEKHNFPRRKKMTLGLGVATYPADAEDPQELLHSADNALCRPVQAPVGPGGVGQPMVL